MPSDTLWSTLVALGMMSAQALQASLPGSDDWSRYQARFIAPDGRVVDTGNGGVSHSEGQGYGMLLAVHHDDRDTFMRLWGWTVAHLRTRGDRLFAWRWVPGAGTTDPNDASDGDLLIAWALLRAGERWHSTPLRDEGLAIGSDVLAQLYRTRGETAYLLPGHQGFAHADGDVINPSYAVFPAFDALAAASGRPEWKRLAASGEALLARARFGRWGLPPDWLKLSDPMAPAPGWAPRFSFDAVRVPLYLMWGGRPAPLLTPFNAFWGTTPNTRPPAWVSLEDGTPAPYPVSVGVQAIAEAARAYPQPPTRPLPVIDDQTDYYAASLLLLTRAMLEERARP